MRKIIFAVLGLFIWQSALAQVQPGGVKEKNAEGFFKIGGNSAGTGTVIKDRSFTASTSDTTEVLSLLDHKTHFVTVMAKDSATIYIAYALSNDGVNFTTFVTKDSLSFNASSGNGLKSVDFSSTTLGAQYAKFKFSFGALAFALGVSSPTYTASWLLKKQ